MKMFEISNPRKASRTIFVGGVSHRILPGEVKSIAMSDDQAEDERASGMLFDAKDKPFTDHTVVELKAIAADENIDLGDATSKKDIVSAIELGREG